MVHQRLNALDVVRNDGSTVVEHVVHCHDGQLALRQFQHLRVQKVHAYHTYTVHAAVAAVLQVRRAPLADIAVDEGDIVAAGLGLRAEALQNARKIFVPQAAVLRVLVQNAQIVCTVRLERTGRGIGLVAHFGRFAAYGLPRLSADVMVAVERFAHCRHGHAAFLCNIPNRNHNGPPFQKFCSAKSKSFSGIYYTERRLVWQNWILNRFRNFNIPQSRFNFNKNQAIFKRNHEVWSLFQFRQRVFGDSIRKYTFYFRQ